MRVIVRRERPHPGAQLTFSDIHGYRFQAFATSTRTGQLAALEARHRAHARVEDGIRTGKDTGYGRFPSRHFQINAVWLELALTAADLIARAQTMLLNGGLATAEPRKLRYQLLHTAGRITRGQRRTWIRIDQTWPWASDLAAAFAGLALLPAPARPVSRPIHPPGTARRSRITRRAIHTPSSPSGPEQDQITGHSHDQLLTERPGLGGVTVG